MWLTLGLSQSLFLWNYLCLFYELHWSLDLVFSLTLVFFLFCSIKLKSKKVSELSNLYETNWRAKGSLALRSVWNIFVKLAPVLYKTFHSITKHCCFSQHVAITLCWLTSENEQEMTKCHSAKGFLLDKHAEIIQEVVYVLYVDVLPIHGRLIWKIWICIYVVKTKKKNHFALWLALSRSWTFASCWNFSCSLTQLAFHSKSVWMILLCLTQI